MWGGRGGREGKGKRHAKSTAMHGRGKKGKAFFFLSQWHQKEGIEIMESTVRHRDRQADLNLTRNGNGNGNGMK